MALSYTYNPFTKKLDVIPSTSTLVPYTGATGDVTLRAHNLAFSDNNGVVLGTGSDVNIKYTGTNWNFNVAQATGAIVFNPSGVNTDFDLTGSITSNLGNYYDGSFWIACRVYQRAI